MTEGDTYGPTDEYHTLIWSRRRDSTIDDIEELLSRHRTELIVNWEVGSKVTGEQVGRAIGRNTYSIQHGNVFSNQFLVIEFWEDRMRHRLDLCWNSEDGDYTVCSWAIEQQP